MKILVPFKQSASVESDFEVSGTEISDKYLDYELNESDEHAIEEALQLSETHDGDVEVVCITIGPARATEAANYVLAMGVDRAIRVWDDELANFGFLDPKAKAEILAAVVRDEEPDVVFTGVQSDDALFGATGIYLAQEVGYAWAAAISGFELDESGEYAKVERELEGGLQEVLETDLPAIFSLQAGMNDPRYVSLRSVYRSNKRPSEMGVTELGLDIDDLGPRFEITHLERPETETVFIEGDPEEKVTELTDILTEHGVMR